MPLYMPHQPSADLLKENSKQQWENIGHGSGGASVVVTMTSTPSLK